MVYICNIEMERKILIYLHTSGIVNAGCKQFSTELEINTRRFNKLSCFQRTKAVLLDDYLFNTPFTSRALYHKAIGLRRDVIRKYRTLPYHTRSSYNRLLSALALREWQ